MDSDTNATSCFILAASVEIKKMMANQAEKEKIHIYNREVVEISVINFAGQDIFKSGLHFQAPFRTLEVAFYKL